MSSDDPRATPPDQATAVDAKPLPEPEPAWDEGTPETDAARAAGLRGDAGGGDRLTADDYRRSAAAHYARAGAADRAAAGILDDDRHAGYLTRHDEQVGRALEERALGQHDSAKANQVERLALERESLDLMVQARQLELSGDADGAAELRGQADAKLAAASDKLDQAWAHAEKELAIRAAIESDDLKQRGAFLLEQGATAMEAYEFPNKNAEAVKTVLVQGMRMAASVLESDGPAGLADAVTEVAARVRDEIGKRFLQAPRQARRSTN